MSSAANTKGDDAWNEAAKRERDELYDAGSDDDFTPKSPKKKKKTKRGKKSTDSDELDPTGEVYAAELHPAPYFYYRNHSTEMDEDPLTPVTQAGHVPCFPAKMHAILANPELHNIVAWDDHGRSFRILKPKKFECDILPKFFEHSKFSSFIRQANGWGFRRLLSGPNRNSYYQEYFLRSMPWLCKKMRRPKVGEKKGISVDHEPDLPIISLQFPVPNNPMTREIQIVLETIKQGPRARMPVHWAGEALPPPAEVPAVAAAPPREPTPVKEKSVAKVSAQNAQVLAPTNNFASGVATLNAFPDQNSTATTAATTAATASPELLNYLRSLNQAKETAATRNAQDNGFAAGFIAATRFHNNNSMNGMLTNSFVQGGPIPLSSHSNNLFPGHHAATLGGPMNSRASTDVMSLLQMQLANQGNNMGGRVVAAVNPVARQSQNGTLTLEQLQAYQAGLSNPNTLHRHRGL
jgi:hypothetical protein